MSEDTPRMYPGTGPDERTTFDAYSAFDVPADLRELHGRYDVETTARRVRNFRYAQEWMMMIGGGWLATIPELPVKTGLGKIIWDDAKSADELGHRLPELRCGKRSVTTSEAANDGFAGLIGGLGFACSANIGDEVAVFEPTHGSAPKYEKLEPSIVNPIAMMLSACMMLDHIGETDKSKRINDAIAAVVSEGKVRTYDMMKLRGGPKAIDQGAATTQQMADAVIARL